MRRTLLAGLVGLGIVIGLGPQAAHASEAVLLVCHAVALSGADSAEEPAKEEASDEKTITVKSERLKIELELDGRFESEQTVEIALRPLTWSKMEVVEVVPHGAAVQAGTPLIQLDLEALERAVVTAKQDLELARLNLETAEVSLDALRKTTPIELAQAELASLRARQDLEYFLTVTRPQSEKSARESLERYQFSLEYAEEELKQLKQMYAEDDLTEETEEIILKRTERGVKQAQSSLESAEIRTSRTLELDLPRQEQTVKANTSKTLANEQKTSASLEAGLRQAEIELEKKRIALRLAEEKLSELVQDMSQLSRITSPIDGFVYYGHVDNGTWSGKEKAQNYLKPGGSIPARAIVMTVVAPRVTHFRSKVSEKDLRKLRPGMAATVAPTIDDSMEAGVTVESVGRIPVSAGSFEVSFRVAETLEGIVEGMGGKVTATTYDQPAALLVPESAVFDDEDEPYVFVKVDGKPSKRVVKTGHKKGSKIEIVDGLTAGASIYAAKPKGM